MLCPFCAPRELAHVQASARAGSLTWQEQLMKKKKEWLPASYRKRQKAHTAIHKVGCSFGGRGGSVLMKMEPPWKWRSVVLRAEELPANTETVGMTVLLPNHAGTFFPRRPTPSLDGHTNLTERHSFQGSWRPLSWPSLGGWPLVRGSHHWSYRAQLPFRSPQNPPSTALSSMKIPQPSPATHSATVYKMEENTH